MSLPYKKIIVGVIVSTITLVSCVGVALSEPTDKSLTIQNQAYLKLFEDDKVQQIDIKIEEATLQQMYDEALEEKYVQADLTINGETFYNIGIRPKGNSSLMNVVAKDSERFSFNVKFDEYMQGQSYYGLSKILLNNNFADPTFMREYLAYKVFEFMGVKVPETGWVDLSINGETHGLYLLVEPVEENFMVRHYDTTNGNLYKPVNQGSDLIWTGDDPDNYTGIEPVWDVTDQDFEKVVDMIEHLNSGEDLETYINIEETLAYLAGSTVLSNFDSYPGGRAHNYYLYEEDGRFTMLPWDLNQSFGGVVNSISIEQHVNTPIYEPTKVPLASRPMIDKLLQVEEYKALYTDHIIKLVQGFFESGLFEKIVRETKELIDPYIKEDPTKFYSYEAFNQSFTETVEGIPGLMTFMDARVESIYKQLNGELPSALDGNGIQADDPRDAEGKAPHKTPGARLEEDNPKAALKGEGAVRPGEAGEQGQMPPGREGTDNPKAALKNKEGSVGNPTNEGTMITLVICAISGLIGIGWVARYKRKR